MEPVNQCEWDSHRRRCNKPAETVLAATCLNAHIIVRWYCLEHLATFGYIAGRWPCYEKLCGRPNLAEYAYRYQGTTDYETLER